MAVQTGRTVSKWVDFIIDDSAGTLRSIPVNSINGLGLTSETVDLTAWQDAITGGLPGMPDFVLTFGGPWDTSAAAAAGTLSGSHTILDGINNGNTPLTLDIQVGIRHAWEAGEPQFGITSDADNGVLVKDYDVDLASGTYTASVYMYPGSSAPAWGVAAET